MNSIVIVIYVVTVPIAQIAEFVLEEVDELERDDFSLAIFFRAYILILTILSVIYIQSFAQSFRNILPFVPFKSQLSSIILLGGLYNVVGAIIRFIEAEIGDYDEYESYQLLFI